MVEQHGAAGEVEVRLGEGDHAVRWCLHRRTFGYRDVHTRVRCLGIAVVDSLVAEAAADATAHGPDEALGEVLPGIVAVACGDDFGLLALDACRDLGRRIHGLRWNAVHAFDGPIARRDRDAPAHLAQRDPDGTLFVATRAENEQT